MGGRRDGRRLLRPSFHLYLLVFTLTIFFGQVPLGLFAAQSPLDSTAHVLLPAAATSLLYDALYHRVVHSAVQYFATMVLLGVGAEMVWEVVEFAGDAAFGLTWQVDNADTMLDIVCGIVGAVLGSAVRVWIWSQPGQVRAARRLVAGGRTLGLLGVAAAFALAPPGYLAYLAWAMPPAPAASSTAAVLPVLEAMLVPRAAADPVPTVGDAVPVGPTPGFVAFTPQGRQAYVAHGAAGVLTVVDTADNEVTATIPVPLGPPRYLAFAPDGGTVYVSIWDDARTVAVVGVLDTGTNGIVATVPMRGRPFLAAVTPDGRWLYVPDHDSGTVAVVDTGTHTVVAEIGVSPRPRSVEFSADGLRAYVADHDTNRVTVIDTATRDPVTEVVTRRGGPGTTGRQATPLVANLDRAAGSVSMVDTGADRVVATVRVGDGPHDLAWAPDRRHAYVTNVDDDTVSVVDATTMTVIATAVTGRAPTSVAVRPDGRQAYVTNLRDGTLTVLHLA